MTSGPVPAVAAARYADMGITGPPLVACRWAAEAACRRPACAPPSWPASRADAREACSHARASKMWSSSCRSRPCFSLRGSEFTGAHEQTLRRGRGRPRPPRHLPTSRAAGARNRAVTGRSAELEHAHVGGRRALRALLGVKRHLRTLSERLEAVAGDRGVMDEQILARVVRRDEPVALIVAEPLHSSGCHAFPPGRSCAAKRGRCKSNNYERWHYQAERQRPARNPESSRPTSQPISGELRANPARPDRRRTLATSPPVERDVS